MNNLLNDLLEERIKSYKNTYEHNNEIHKEFTENVYKLDFLNEHRTHIENNKLGFGDRAFHYMWYLIIKSLVSALPSPNVLEIGVYKGQVISLWSLLANNFAEKVFIYAVSPLEGNPEPKSLFEKFKTFLNKRQRIDFKVGNYYTQDNYLYSIESLFSKFNLEFNDVKLIQGYSNDIRVISKVKERYYDLIYIDGDHSFEVVKEDIINYSPLIRQNGYLVMDDASYYLPGNKFWKGYKSVADACQLLPELGFQNVLNVGHNRVFKKCGI